MFSVYLLSCSVGTIKLLYHPQIRAFRNCRSLRQPTIIIISFERNGSSSKIICYADIICGRLGRVRVTCRYLVQAHNNTRIACGSSSSRGSILAYSTMNTSDAPLFNFNSVCSRCSGGAGYCLSYPGILSRSKLEVREISSPAIQSTSGKSTRRESISKSS